LHLSDSRRALTPGLYLRGFFIPPTLGVLFFLANFLASSDVAFLGVARFAGVCLVRAIVKVKCIIQ